MSSLIALHAEPCQLLQITITDTTAGLSAPQPPPPPQPIPSLTSFPLFPSMPLLPSPHLSSPHHFPTPTSPFALSLLVCFFQFIPVFIASSFLQLTHSLSSLTLSALTFFSEPNASSVINYPRVRAFESTGIHRKM